MEKKGPTIQRARCPCFLARTDYKKGRYIQCSGTFWRFRDTEARDEHYRGCCCGALRECGIFEERHATKAGRERDG